MVNREVKSSAVSATASTATRFRVRLARRLRSPSRSTQPRFATFISAAPSQPATMRPSSMRTVRSAVWAISSLWVIITMVWPKRRPVTFIRPRTS